MTSDQPGSRPEASALHGDAPPGGVVAPPAEAATDRRGLVQRRLIIAQLVLAVLVVVAILVVVIAGLAGIGVFAHRTL